MKRKGMFRIPIVFFLSLAANAVCMANSPLSLPPDSDAMNQSSQVLQATSGPRTSPFEPPKENDISFVTDDAPKLDTGCIFSSLGPIEFDIEITRHVGELNNNGTLKNAGALVSAGLLSKKATLVIPAFDVDSDANPSPPFLPEQDRVLFNGEEIGFLSGENNTWKLNTFQIDISKVKFANRAAVGSEPKGAANRVTIEIDVGNSPTQVWCTSVDWGSAGFKAMSPIILVHGNNSDGDFFRRQGFTETLMQQNLLFDDSINLPTTTIAANGSSLNGFIPDIVKSFGVDSVHLVAHSKGGLDSREYLAKFQPTNEQSFTVLSYNTLSTPHNGSVGADLLVLRDQAAIQAAETEFADFPTFTETVINQVGTDAGTPNLTTGFTATFNTTNLPLISNNIIVNTVAADADRNGNDEIDRDPDEYAALRAESQRLQDLDDEFFGQTQSRIAVNIPYQILRGTASVTLTLEQRTGFFGGERTVAILTGNPTPQPLGNDVLVTIPSGQGQNSVAARTSNTQVFEGANGRNHSDVADRGVAQTVVPWIIGAEKKNGDLK